MARSLRLGNQRTDCRHCVPSGSALHWLVLLAFCWAATVITNGVNFVSQTRMHTLRGHASEHSSRFKRLVDCKATAATWDTHNEVQAAAFDKRSSFFASEAATPPTVVPALQRIATAALESIPVAGLLVDVGCGTGALVPFLVDSGLSLDRYLAVDLSNNMLSGCRARLAAIAAGGNGLGAVAIEASGSEQSSALGGARLWQGDVVRLSKQDALGGQAEVLHEGSWALHCAGAGSVVFNAVFGNVFDQRAALEAAAALLQEGGRIVISHPLGRAFHERLRAGEIDIVPHALPDTATLSRLLSSLPLEVVYSEGTEDPEGNALYLTVLRKVPVALLSEPFFARGAVAQGYGRGSKKLGFPTANLPASLFSGRLADVAAGVYSGWAALNGVVYAAVANVGFSPTFAGSENREKIVEAHLIDYPDDLGDFYEQELSFLFVAWQRPELKFGGLAELSAAIAKDARDARSALMSKPLMVNLKKHPILWDTVKSQHESTEWRREPLEVWLGECPG